MCILRLVVFTLHCHSPWRQYLQPSQFPFGQVLVERPGHTQAPCEVLSWADRVGMCRFHFLFLQSMTSKIKSKIKASFILWVSEHAGIS